MLLAMIVCPMLAAPLVWMIGRRSESVRNGVVRGVTLLMLAWAIKLFWDVYANGTVYVQTLSSVCGLGLHFRADGFRALYALITGFMGAMTTLFSAQYFAHLAHANRYWFFTMMTLGATTGLFLSDDLYTTFIFFEMMSMASYAWVAHEETPGAMRAAATYLGISVLGGMVTLMGMFLVWNQIGSLSFAALEQARGTSSLTLPLVLMLFGYMVKAGAFPVHVWLPKAHPVAPAPASALLSGLLTKTGMFAVLGITLNGFLGNVVFGSFLLVIALLTMLIGAVLALFSVHLKRALACSSMSQIGYILTGVAAAVLLGEENALPAAGAVAHMINHSVLKLTLFLAAGTVHMNLHELDMNKIRGFGRKKPFLHIAFLLGALGLMGVPLFNGYLSKTMIHEGLVEVGMVMGSFWYTIAEWVFLFAAGITTGYMLTWYIGLFWQKNDDPAQQARFDAMGKTYLTFRSRIALGLPALVIPFLGAHPSRLLGLVRGCAGFLRAEPVEAIAFFNGQNLLGGGITLVIGTVLYLTVVRKWIITKEGYVNRWPARWDWENAIYRPVFCEAIPKALGAASRVLDQVVDGGIVRFGLPAMGKAWRVLSQAVEGRVIRRVLPAIALTFCRLMDELVDHIGLLIQAALFHPHTFYGMRQPETVYMHGADVVRNTAAHWLGRFRRNQPYVEDMRYGDAVTNAISFGLILSVIGFLVAVGYVLFRTMA